MKYEIYLNDKPIEEATPTERMLLEKQVVEATKKYLGLIIPFDERECLRHYENRK